MELPPPGFGTAGYEDDECVAAVERALAAGYRHVDTAQMYENEAAVGTAIERSGVDRDELVVATKVHPENLGHDDVIDSTRESLERLGLDRVDLLYVHWPIEAYDAPETLAAMDAVRDRGWTDHVGLSNFTPELLAAAREHLEAPIGAHQVECHPLLAQETLRADALAGGYPLVGYCPLIQGDAHEVDVLVEIADAHDATPHQVCLAWSLAREPIVPIPKGRGEHVEENWAARELELSPTELGRIDAIEETRRIVDPERAPWNRD